MLRIFLFKRLSLEHCGQSLPPPDGRKAQELLAYLLLHRQSRYSREWLLDLLWPEQKPTQARKYLRQALWQVQSALTDYGCPSPIQADTEWVAIAPDAALWLDTEIFETTYAQIRDLPIHLLDEVAAQVIHGAIAHYKGWLLEGWYQEWVLHSRDHYQIMYLMLLDKLMRYCETTGAYELGLKYGESILQFDRAHERAYQCMMRCYYFSGNRTGALRQYERCVVALDTELGIAPARQTQTLYQQIREDLLGVSASGTAVMSMLTDLRYIQGQLTRLLTMCPEQPSPGNSAPLDKHCG